MDHFRIELACVGGSIPTVDFASGFTEKVQVRSSSPAEENARGRLYFLWQEHSALGDHDRQLLQQAGITTRNRFILKFISKTLEQRLAELESLHASAQGRELDDVSRTVFAVHNSGGEFAFQVEHQSYVGR